MQNCFLKMFYKLVFGIYNWTHIGPISQCCQVFLFVCFILLYSFCVSIQTDFSFSLRLDQQCIDGYFHVGMSLTLYRGQLAKNRSQKVKKKKERKSLSSIQGKNTSLSSKYLELSLPSTSPKLFLSPLPQGQTPTFSNNLHCSTAPHMQTRFDLFHLATRNSNMTMYYGKKAAPQSDLLFPGNFLDTLLDISLPLSKSQKKNTLRHSTGMF